MKFEWVDSGRGYHVARVGSWKLEVLSQTGHTAHVTVSLDGASAIEGRCTTLDETKAAAERWVLEYVAPFVEAAVQTEREACAEIADGTHDRAGLCDDRAGAERRAGQTRSRCRRAGHQHRAGDPRAKGRCEVRRKVTLSIYLEPKAEAELRELSRATRVPIAVYLREAVDMLLAKNRDTKDGAR